MTDNDSVSAQLKGKNREPQRRRGAHSNTKDPTGKTHIPAHTFQDHLPKTTAKNTQRLK